MSRTQTLQLLENNTFCNNGVFAFFNEKDNCTLKAATHIQKRKEDLICFPLQGWELWCFFLSISNRKDNLRFISWCIHVFLKVSQ